jgi:hypothetical protein
MRTKTTKKRVAQLEAAVAKERGSSQSSVSLALAQVLSPEELRALEAELIRKAQLVGRDGVVSLAEVLTPEQMNAVRARLGEAGQGTRSWLAAGELSGGCAREGCYQHRLGAIAVHAAADLACEVGGFTSPG